MNLEKQIEKDINYFQSKADKYGFTTTWCLTEIRALSLKSPFKGKWMSDSINDDVKVSLPNKKLTGLELWKYADELYNKLGYGDHRFIESFEVKGDTIEVFFGS
jgi:hypothetical protein